ncbi:Beta-galactosidase [Limihaloglobus sulfuriphilus]|uniref:Probable pectate lyase C n=1 Tax=Limihaloglobus sulfuriphilus TaxID=1851148 RepID=A0A1Q2MDE7_9BACT|nr:beta-galactosidase [Limihaloglobus sulfuriphilus]AQQ70711.1 Beta-galactosidase [Limihaloglobus sulfuriphilus]
MNKTTQFLLLSILCACSAFGLTFYNFDDAGGSHLWSDTGNWEEGVISDISTGAIINTDFQASGKYCFVNNGTRAECATLWVGSNTANTLFKINGGVLETLPTGTVRIGVFADSHNSILEIAGGEAVVGSVLLPHNSAAQGCRLKLTSGTFYTRVVNISGDAAVEFKDGVLVLDGDARELVNDHIANGVYYTTYSSGYSWSVDYGLTVSGKTAVMVKHDDIPYADAGDDSQSWYVGQRVMLDGSGSFAGGGIASYQWSQLEGPVQVNILDSDAALASFDSNHKGHYRFSLHVEDELGNVDSDVIDVHIEEKVKDGIYIKFRMIQGEDQYGVSWQTKMERVLELDHVTGIKQTIYWNALEPEEGQYNWEYFDYPLELARQKGKMVSLMVKVCSVTPDWVMDKCQKFGWTHPVTGNEVSPVPWDPVYVAEMTKMVKAVAARYNGHPNLHYVSINGPSSLWGVETNFPGTMVESQAQILGYTYDKYINGWKYSIDLFLQEYPDTPVSLALHSETGGSGTAAEQLAVAQTIRDYALQRNAELKGGDNKMVLALYGLNHDARKMPGPFDGRENMTDYVALVWDVKDQCYFGLESDGIRRFQEDTPEKFLQILKNGLSYSANWMEMYYQDVWVWQTDTRYEPYIPPFKWAYGRYPYITAAGPVKNLTSGKEYDLIQHGICDSSSGDLLTVENGVYNEFIDFEGKNIHLSSGGAVINANGYGPAVIFESGENSNCSLRGFILTEGTEGVICSGGSSPVIENCTIVSNQGLGISSADSNPLIDSCIIWDNDQGSFSGGSPVYSCIEGNPLSSNGNISLDPCFADPENGNYQLKSQAGRWLPEQKKWFNDPVASPCIDGGSAMLGYSSELWPHGGRVNMGAFGGSAMASLSNDNTGIAADFNADGCVDYLDLDFIVSRWLSREFLLKADINRDGRVDLYDFSQLPEEW